MDALEYLIETRDGVLEAVKGLSEAQWRFRPSPDRWSGLENVEHLALVGRRVVEIMGRAGSSAGGSRRSRSRINRCLNFGRWVSLLKLTHYPVFHRARCGGRPLANGARSAAELDQPSRIRSVGRLSMECVVWGPQMRGTRNKFWSSNTLPVLDLLPRNRRKPDRLERQFLELRIAAFGIV
jgi:hypothetical protein